MATIFERFNLRYPEMVKAIDAREDNFINAMVAWKLLDSKYIWSDIQEEFLSAKDYKRMNQGVKIDKACWITIAPSKYRVPIPYTEENINTLINFGNSISFLYKNYLFVVESGKHPNTPHLHIHILGVMRNSKKHLAQLRAKWEQICGFVIDWKSDDYDCRQHRNKEGMIGYDEWVTEKISYMDNERKGTHQNFEVLMAEPGGSGGF